MKICAVTTPKKSRKVNCKNKPFKKINGKWYCKKHLKDVETYYAAKKELGM